MGVSTCGNGRAVSPESAGGRRCASRGAGGALGTRRSPPAFQPVEQTPFSVTPPAYYPPSLFSHFRAPRPNPRHPACYPEIEKTPLASAPPPAPTPRGESHALILGSTSRNGFVPSKFPHNAPPGPGFRACREPPRRLCRAKPGVTGANQGRNHSGPLMSNRSTAWLEAMTHRQSMQWRRPKVWPNSWAASFTRRARSRSSRAGRP